MLAMTQAIVLIVVMLIFGGESSNNDSELRHLAGDLEVTPPDTILQDLYGGLIPKWFNYESKVYSIHRIQPVNDFHNYLPLFLIDPFNIDGEEQFLLFRYLGTEYDTALSHVPKYFLAMSQHSAAMYETKQEKNHKGFVYHELVIKERKWKLQEIHGVDPDPQNPLPREFVEVPPNVKPVKFGFDKFRVQINIAPTNSQKFRECDFQPTISGFRSRPISHFYLFRIDDDGKNKWQLSRQLTTNKETEFDRMSAHVFRVYSLSKNGVINLYDIKCRWTDKVPEGDEYALSYHEPGTLVMSKLSQRWSPRHMLAADDGPRFVYEFGTKGNTIDVTLIDRSDIPSMRVMNSSFEDGRRYSGEAMFDHNRLYAIVAPQHFRCFSDPKGHSHHLRSIENVVWPITLEEFKEIGIHWCNKDDKPLADSSDPETSQRSEHCGKNRFCKSVPDGTIGPSKRQRQQ